MHSKRLKKRSGVLDHLLSSGMSEWGLWTCVRQRHVLFFSHVLPLGAPARWVSGMCRWRVFVHSQACGWSQSAHPKFSNTTGVPLPWAWLRGLPCLLLLVDSNLKALVYSRWLWLESTFGQNVDRLAATERRFPRAGGGILDFIDPSHDWPWLQIKGLTERRSNPVFSLFMVSIQPLASALMCCCRSYVRIGGSDIVCGSVSTCQTKMCINSITSWLMSSEIPRREERGPGSQMSLIHKRCKQNPAELIFLVCKTIFFLKWLWTLRLRLRFRCC